MMEAGCTVIGGHSIRDDETKFGYAVTGKINPQRVMVNGEARAGDRLLLTKRIGTGVISTAIKKGAAEEKWIDAAVHSMTTLNKAAAEVATRPEFEVHTMTDITGFGLIGHAREIAVASEVSMRVFANQVPPMEGAFECIRAGHIPGGLKANREFAECVVAYDEGIEEDVKMLMFDPQTAGGLLISVRDSDSQRLAGELQSAGVEAAEIGEVIAHSKSLISVANT